MKEAVEAPITLAKALAGAGSGAHAADNARKASPVPPAPAKSDRILFPEDNFTTGPANAEVIHPPPALSANNARITAHCEAWFFEVSPAHGTGIASFITRSLLTGAVSLQGNDRRDGTSVRIMAGL